jgi:SAM-dependent methyltransferase
MSAVNATPVITSGTPAGRTYLDLFLVSFLLLFFELACIRWFGSTVVFLTFFTNIILLATFLGMSVGCLAASGRRDWTHVVLPLLLFVTLLAVGLLWTGNRFGRVLVDVGGQGSPEQVYFGTEFVARDVGSFVVPIELLAALFFLLIALMFAGVGQVMGRAFAAAPDRLIAYICNIAGSLAGIAAFAAASYLRTAPLVWFAVVGAIWMHFLARRTTWQTGTLVATLLVFGLFGSQASVRAPFQRSLDYRMLMWSPYYKILYTPAHGMIVTNNISHQQIVPVGSAPAYLLPHLLNRDAGRPPFARVLIIGAGSGNDVATALANGATHVDAVEIDPALYEIGRANHPNHPYQDSRVTVHIDDGRNFLRRTDRQYDLIVYALVDSLVLHSGYSSLRLESFLFTQQAFDDIAARLAPGGVFAGYNFYRQGWIVGRIQRLAERSFGSAPLVMSLPYVERIGVNDPQASRMTFILGSRGDGLAPVRRQFQTHDSFWINATPAGVPVNGYRPRPPDGEDSGSRAWLRIAPAAVEIDRSDRVPTDDWPFLYLRDRVVPALNLRNMGLLALLSVGFLYVMSPTRPIRINWPMFLLGAGFMLLETKSVVHMALLFGSTWIVNSVVFFAILVMILASNVFVLLVRPERLWPYYALLVVAFAVNIAVPMSRFLALDGSAKVVASCAVVFVPIFFAGIIFGTLFARSTEPDVDFGSNIAGAMAGGFAEALALVVGFNYLLLVAVVFYLLSALLRRPARTPFSLTV